MGVRQLHLEGALQDAGKGVGIRVMYTWRRQRVQPVKLTCTLTGMARGWASIEPPTHLIASLSSTHTQAMGVLGSASLQHTVRFTTSPQACPIGQAHTPHVFTSEDSECRLPEKQGRGDRDGQHEVFEALVSLPHDLLSNPCQLRLCILKRPCDESMA